MLLDSRIQDPGCRIQDPRCRIQDTGYKIQDAGYRRQVAGIWIEGVRDSGVGCQDWILDAL